MSAGMFHVINLTHPPGVSAALLPGGGGGGGGGEKVSAKADVGKIREHVQVGLGTS
jgi:hypothetical protein